MGSHLPCVLPFESPKNWREKWANRHGRCIQGNNTNYTHKGDLAYAFDFKLKPGSKVLAARDGVVAAFCDHFREGGLRDSLRPRANFVALRHIDGTYTRYVHLMHGGVLVRLGQEVKARQPIALSGNTGFSSGAHLHFDAINILPQETSELQVLYPKELTLPSIAAIFSGPLCLGKETVAPLVYLSPAVLARHSQTRRVSLPKPKPNWSFPVEHRFRPTALRPRPATMAKVAASSAPPRHHPLFSPYPEVVVLIDRGGADGNQTFAEAAAQAADVIGTALIISATTVARGDGDGEGFYRCCRCVGVIITNNRSGHELFPMAPPQGEQQQGGWRRAPFPVAMVSYESGRMLKETLSAASAAAMELPELRRWAYSRPPLKSWLLPDSIDCRVVVSLGAAEHCPVGSSSCPPQAPYYNSTSCRKETNTTASRLSSFADSTEDDYEGDTSAEAGIYTPGRRPFSGHHGFRSNVVEQPRFAGQVGARAKGVEREVETTEWKHERMLYRSQTLPVNFER